MQVDEAFGAEVDTSDLARAVLAVLSVEDRADAEVTLLVTTDEAVATLNQRYRGVEDPTDVLSFPAQEGTSGFVTAPEATAYLGDIVIALPFARRQAEALARELADEMRLLAVHGTLHLLGYDHAEPNAEAAMWARQDTILAGLEAGG